MLPAEQESESQHDRTKLSHYELDRVLVYSDVNNLTIDAFTIEDPGLIDITSEDSGNDIQQERISLSSGDVHLLKEDSTLDKEVMDRGKQFKSKNRKTNSSAITSRKKNVDFKNNTGLIGMKISQRDVIVDDVPDVNQNATNKSTKKKVCDPRSVKVVPERDVYERIIGKAYDNIKSDVNLQRADNAHSLSNNSSSGLKNASNLSANNSNRASFQTCHKPLEELSVYKIIDSERPKKVCRSKSLCIPSVQKTIESEKDVYRCKTRNKTKEVNFKSSDDNNFHNSKITTKEFTLNQNIKTHSRDKSKSTMMIHAMSTPIIIQAAKGEGAKITGQCGTVNSKPNIHNRKNHQINTYDYVSSEGSKMIKPTDKKIVTKSIDDQVVNQVTPKVAASISKNRRNTISSAGQITKSTNSEKITKVRRKTSIPNFDDHITELNLIDEVTKPAYSDKARNRKIKNDNLNCNNQLKILKDATIPKLNNDKPIELTKDKMNAKSNRHTTTSRVDVNNKPDGNERPIEIKRKLIHIIDDQVLPSFVPKVTASTSSVNVNNKPNGNKRPIENKRKLIHIIDDQALPSFVPKVAASTSSVDVNNKPDGNKRPIETKRKLIHIIDDQVLPSFVPKIAASVSSKRRNTVSSIYPENTSLKVCSKSIFRDDKIIPHYHTCMLGNQTGEKNKDNKTNADTKTTPVKLIKDKSPLEVNPETLIERNENNENPCNDNNAASLSRSKPSVTVVMNKNITVIESTDPNKDFSSNALQTVLPKPLPKFDSTIKENVSYTLDKDIDIPDRLNTENNTEQLVRTFDSIPRETIPVVLNMVPYPNQQNCNNFSSAFPIQSIVSNRPLQESQTNICLSPRAFHTGFPRSPRQRSWRAPYPYNYNQSNSFPNNQYPIFNRLMNAGTFVRNPYSSRTLAPPPKFQHSPHPLRPNSPYLPPTVLNTSPKDTQVVNIKDWEETISSKIKNPSNEAPAVENTASGKENNSFVKNVKISEAETIDRPPVKLSQTENINIINDTKVIPRTEQKSSEKICNEEKPPEKEYSPAILPLLSFPQIFDILETSGYDYPNLKSSAYNRTEWINKDCNDRPNLDKTKSKMNGDGTQDKKGKISISEYKKRLAVTTTKENE